MFLSNTFLKIVWNFSTVSLYPESIRPGKVVTNGMLFHILKLSLGRMNALDDYKYPT